VLAGDGTRHVAAALVVTALVAWWMVVRDARAMVMPTAVGSLADGARYTAQWGVMMAAMMLPAAAPMILLYDTVSRRLSSGGDRVIPPSLFATVYLLAWTLPGVPLYLAHVGLRAASARWPQLDALVPYGVAGVLLLAGLYQFTRVKRACLRHCESPLGFLMRRWRGGYGATLRLAAAHAGYCLGCCWALMAILVVAGAMSLPWVLAITLAVSAEKLLPHGGRTARIVGVLLIALGVAIAIEPGLASRIDGDMRGGMRDEEHGPMQMPMPMAMPMP
jgi:predicted metal-binding membrane protein